MHIGVTVMETLISFALVTVFGLLIAILLWSSRSVSEVLEPYLVMLNSLPKSALAPILIVWLGNNIKTIIVASISVAVFGCIMTLHTGFSQVDPDMIKLIYSLGGTKKGCSFQGTASWFCTSHHQQYKGQYRALSGWCYYWGIFGGE